ncbi:MAG: tyrosine-type recombinase/integrase [Gammaproteobacteria bacterium]|nr:tyrosine-type recombinase/integrase [Gammaproteobacteria bacterium]MDP2346378.1 tyrosine-type recombinase/integrase [Gammaproteobacteria bacterium]
MPVIALTPKFISTLQCEPGKSRTEWCDSEVKGLYVEARATSPSLSSYYLRYKDEGGKTRHLRLGNTDTLSLSQARMLAADKKSEIRQGSNPSLDRKQQKQIPTFKQFVVEQYAPYCKVRKRSWHTDELRFNQRLFPEFGDTRMDRITTKQLIDFHSELREVHQLAPATADHFIKLVRHLYNMAIKWGVIDRNPAARISLFNADNRVENIMDETQLRKLLLVLNTHPNRRACRIAMFLLATGCRMNEALTASWDQIDWEQKVWRVPALNSKSKRMRPVPLNESAIDILQQVREEHPQWVFYNPDTDTHFKTLHNGWYMIREAAGMPWLRIHDLRHTYASMIINSGRTLYEVQSLLGHSTPQVTQRYAHMNTQTLLNASEVASQRIRAASPRLLPAALPQDS